MRLSELAEIVEGDIEGNELTDITGVGKIESAGRSEITFLSNPMYEKFFETTNAGCVIVSREFEPKIKRSDISVLRVDDPYLSFIRLLEMFERNVDEELEGISDTSVVGDNTELGENIYIGEFVSIAKNCRIGSATKIMSNCSIEAGAVIGEGCLLYPNVSVYKDCRIGDNVIIHSGTVIGSDGFGFAKNSDGSYMKIPQTGNVIIEDNVEIGSNTSIDRATIGSTVIGKGVKIDNQVQIAHNVEIGENTVIAAQVGIAGSAKIGKRCIIAGQAGIVGHLSICDDVIIGAAVGVSKSITEPGIYTGYRARPQKEDLRNEIRIRNLEALEKRIKEIEGQIKKSE
jgi:UDP-3-O-[3-hydroxymyristoyl] glucosamine N-acyltransferase